jgi:methyl-accepting chemotaxis protein
MDKNSQNKPSFLTKFSIATRLGGGFAILVALILVMSLYGIYGMRGIQAKLNEIANVNDTESALVATMRASVYQRAILIRNLALLTDQAAMADEQRKIELQRKAYDEAKGKLSALLARPEASPQEKDIFIKLQGYEAATEPPVNKAIALGLANRGEEATKTLLTEVEGPQSAWLDQLNKLVLEGESLNAEAGKHAEASYETARASLLAVSALAAIVGILVSIFLSRSITRPIGYAVEITQRVASGDFTARIDVESDDEIGKLLQAIKGMNESLGQVIRQTRENAHKVAGAAAELSTAAGQIADSSRHQSEAASSMAAAVEEMTVSVGQISDHASGAQRVSSESSDLSREGSGVITEMIGKMQEISKTVNESSSVMEELTKRSEEISSIVLVIKEVADQTNLLALNAAIEAARAGEQGRGFAVVADEVRKLAERTAQSTLDISSVIEKVQQGINAVMETMGSGVEQVELGVMQAGKAVEAVDRINAGSQQVVDNVSDISSALREQSIANNEIAQSVEKIAQMAEENNSAVEETARTALNLQTLATELNELVSRFKV